MRSRGQSFTAALQQGGLFIVGVLLAGLVVIGLLLLMAPAASAQFDTPEPGTCRIDEVVETALSQTQCDALVAFYWATNGPAWSQQMAWNTPSDPCTWGGVLCAPRPGYAVVEQLSIHQNNLTGYLPEQIDGLSGLRKLRLSSNGIGGTIPSHVGHLQQVQVIDLSGNAFVGQVPPRLGDLPHLRILDLSANALTGELPIELTQLTGLTQLRLERNHCFQFNDQVERFVEALIESGDLANCDAPGVAVSCLAGRGRLDVALDNHGAQHAMYSVTVGALAPRLRSVAGGGSDSVAVTGRPEGRLDVRVLRNGELHLAETVTIDCQPDGDAEISGRCVGSSLTDQLLDATLANLGEDSAVYLLLVEGFPARRAVVDARSTGRITMAVPARGTLGVTVTRNGEQIYSGADGFDC